MTPRHRQYHRWLWLLLVPPVAAVLVLAARMPTEPPANLQWPAVVPAEND